MAVATGGLTDIITALEDANSRLDVDALEGHELHQRLADYARIEKLAAYGVAATARKIDDVASVAKVAGTSLGRAKDAVVTGKALSGSQELGAAFARGEVSLDQASEIAKAEQSCPGVAGELLEVAANDTFQMLRDSARRLKLEAEQHRGLASRQRAARSARTYSDELGMCHIHLALQPHVGAPIAARAEAQAKRLYRAAKRTGEPEAFPAYLADAYAEMLAGRGKARTTRPELVVLVSHEVAKRGEGRTPRRGLQDPRCGSDRSAGCERHRERRVP